MFGFGEKGCKGRLASQVHCIDCTYDLFLEIGVSPGTGVAHCVYGALRNSKAQFLLFFYYQKQLLTYLKVPFQKNSK